LNTTPDSYERDIRDRDYLFIFGAGASKAATNGTFPTIYEFFIRGFEIAENELPGLGQNFSIKDHPFWNCIKLLDCSNLNQQVFNGAYDLWGNTNYSLTGVKSKNDYYSQKDVTEKRIIEQRIIFRKDYKDKFEKEKKKEGDGHYDFERINWDEVNIEDVLQRVDQHANLLQNDEIRIALRNFIVWLFSELEKMDVNCSETPHHA